MDLNQVTIPSTDMPTAVSFYKRLGLILIVDALPRYARFECPDGTSTFSIHHVNEVSSVNGIILYFECKDLDKLIDQLQAKGMTFDEPPSDRKWLWREARLKDPDGHQIILYYAGENRKNPPWRIT